MVFLLPFLCFFLFPCLSFLLWFLCFSFLCFTIPPYKPSVLLLLLLLLLLLQNSCMQQFWNSCTILDLCLKSEIMDGFWSSRLPAGPIVIVVIVVIVIIVVI